MFTFQAHALLFTFQAHALLFTFQAPALLFTFQAHALLFTFQAHALLFTFQAHALLFTFQAHALFANGRGFERGTIYHNNWKIGWTRKTKQRGEYNFIQRSTGANSITRNTP